MKDKTIDFLFVVHNHQPVGNFDHVIGQAADDAYIPFLKLLFEYPEIKIGLHTSGCLWDWLIANRPEYLELCRELVRREQVELLGGGYYEPILTLLPERDLKRQFARMNTFAEENFGVVLEGFWCTERVWQPTIPWFLKNTQMKYTLLDDNHFLSTGLQTFDLGKPFLTESLGVELTLLPISEKLRYHIPFSEVKRVEGFFRQKFNSGGGLLVFGDDGEKFGVWPGTDDWVWNRGWIRDFFDMLRSNQDWIRTHQPKEYLLTHTPKEFAFLPATSYREMTGWAMPAKSVSEFENAWKKIENTDDDSPAKRFFRGGHFTTFLSKYSESARMYRELLYVSELLSKSNLDTQLLDEAAMNLDKGMCNCAYWHGVFGGLYLNYLRNAVYKNFIAAKRILYANTENCIKFSSPRHVRLSNSELEIEVDLQNGQIEAIDFLPSATRLTDVLTRRYEGYHDKIIEAVVGDNESHDSIHNAIRAKEAGLQDTLFYDRRSRASFDVILTERGASAQRLMKGDLHWFDGVVSDVSVIKCDANEYSMNCLLSLLDDVGSMNMSKSVKLREDSATIDFELELRPNVVRTTTEFDVVVSFDFGLLAGDSPDRYYELLTKHERMMFTGDISNTDSISLVDEWQGFRITIHSSAGCSYHVYPIETVSASEGGLERTYQGSSVNAVRPFNFADDHSILDWRFSITITHLVY